jgi:hypothetical protein
LDAPVPDRSPKKRREGDKEMKTKMFAIFATLMITLTIAGFVYAHWTDEIYINGTVEMGELIFGFTTCGPCEDGKMVDDVIVTPEPKPVGEVTCELSEPETSVHLPEPKTVFKKMTITITSAYPEYVAICPFTLDNGGSIPLDVTLYCVPVEPVDGLTYRWEDTDGDGSLDTIVGFIDTNANGMRDDPDEPAVINIWFEPWFGGQIDPCESKPSAIYIHIKEPAEECHTYAFEITIHAEQWN